jgi:hypothetical protein
MDVNTQSENSQGGDSLLSAITALSRADMALSRAEMELSKAETSVGGFETAWGRWAKIIIALFVLVMAYLQSLHSRQPRNRPQQ